MSLTTASHNGRGNQSPPGSCGRRSLVKDPRGPAYIGNDLIDLPDLTPVVAAKRQRLRCHGDICPDEKFIDHIEPIGEIGPLGKLAASEVISRREAYGRNGKIRHWCQ